MEKPLSLRKKHKKQKKMQKNACLECFLNWGGEKIFLMVFQVEISEIYEVQHYSGADCGRKRKKGFKLQEELN